MSKELKVQQGISGYWYGMGAVAIWTGFILVSRYGGVGPLMANDIIAIRYLTCSLVLIPIWYFYQRFNLFNIRLIGACLLGGLAYALCAFYGFTYAPASHAAVLMPGTLPVLTVLLAFLVNGERHRLNKWLGVGVMSMGIGGLIWMELSTAQSLNPGHGLFVGAAFFWALFTVLVHRWGITPWQATIGLAFVTAVAYLPVYLVWLPKNITSASWQDVALQAVYQGVLATVIQMVLYMKAVKTIGPASMGSLMALVPVLGGLLAVVVFDEPLTNHLVLGLLLVSMGSLLAHGKWFLKRETAACPT